MTQKAQLALGRMVRELTETTTVASAQNSALIFTIPSGERAIGLADGELKLSVGSADWAQDGDTLISGVNRFDLSYINETGGDWDGSEITDLAAIKIELVLNHTDMDTGTVTFRTHVNPRNNGNANAPTGGTDG
jgi:hypothetical protein